MFWKIVMHRSSLIVGLTFHLSVYFSSEQLAKFQHLRRAKRQNYHEKCECKYSPGGCRIQTAPPKGYKCKCEYIFLWTCWGFGQDCVKGEQCPPAYCKSHWCCQLGGGDCKGYTRIWFEKKGITNWFEMTAITKWFKDMPWKRVGYNEQ